MAPPVGTEERGKRMSRSRWLMALVLLVAGGNSELAAEEDGPIEAACAAATAALDERIGFVARVDLGNMASFFVRPDGSPVAGLEQQEGGYKGSTLWAPGGSVLVRAGESGRRIVVVPRVRGSQVPKAGRNNPNWYWVLLNRKHRPNSAAVAVIHDRPVTPEDITPEKIARALSSLVTIRGHEVGAGVAAAFDQVLEQASETAVPTAPGPAASATLVAVEVWAEPEVVAPGDEVKLVLRYEVGAAAETSETRELWLGESMMPNFPRRETLARGAGSHTSAYRQRLPPAATPGSYRFVGEVCAGGDCIRRAATFEVRAP